MYHIVLLTCFTINIPINKENKRAMKGQEEPQRVFDTIEFSVYTNDMKFCSTDILIIANSPGAPLPDGLGNDVTQRFHVKRPC